MSARRRARAARAVRAAPVVEGVPVPEELLDDQHPVWHDQRRYRAWMAERGWVMPAAERFGVATAPANRRAAAATGWARAHGLDASRRQLTAWGLVHPDPAPPSAQH